MIRSLIPLLVIATAFSTAAHAKGFRFTAQIDSASRDAVRVTVKSNLDVSYPEKPERAYRKYKSKQVTDQTIRLAIMKARKSCEAFGKKGLRYIDHGDEETRFESYGNGKGRVTFARWTLYACMENKQ